MLKGTKLYEAKVKDFNEGVFAISLVDKPAVEKDFVLFKESDKAPLRFSVDDEMEHIISGVVMLADTPIYRRNGDFEYYIYYSPETIKLMSQKMLEDQTFNNIDLQHDGEYIPGVKLVEVYIKDSSKGISPNFVEDVPDGSLMASFKIEDEQLWDEIKNGDALKGFSLEGLFTMEEVNKEKDKNIMSKIGKFIKNLMKYSEVESDKGKLYWGEGELEVGTEVYVDSEDGEKVAAGDGEYIVEDKVIVIAEGKVSEIKVKEEEPEVVEVDAKKQHFMKVVALMSESYEEKIAKIADAIRAKGFDAWVIEAADDYAVAEIWVEENMDYKHYRFPVSWNEAGDAEVGDPEEVKSEFVPVDEEVLPVVEEPKADENFEEEVVIETPGEEPEAKVSRTEFDEKIAELEGKNIELQAQIDELKSAFEELNNAPAAEPIAEEFAKAVTVNDFKTKGAKLFSHLND